MCTYPWLAFLCVWIICLFSRNNPASSYRLSGAAITTSSRTQKLPPAEVGFTHHEHHLLLVCSSLSQLLLEAVLPTNGLQGLSASGKPRLEPEEPQSSHCMPSFYISASFQKSSSWEYWHSTACVHCVHEGQAVSEQSNSIVQD